MKLRGKEIPFPAITQVSFYKLIETLEAQALDSDKNVAAFAKSMLADCAKYPQIKEGMPVEEFDKDNELVKRLSRLLFPDVLLTNEIKGIIPPFEFKTFYESTRLKNILQNTDDDFSFDLNDYTEDQLYIYGCVAILGACYHLPVKLGLPTMVDIPDRKQQVEKTYRLAMNGDMMEIIPTDKAIPITQEDYLQLLDNFEDVALWKQKFPPESYVMRGICIINLMDVTTDHSIAGITANLLVKSTEGIKRIYEGLRNHFGIADLQVGFVMYENDTFLNIMKEGMTNMILGGKDSMKCLEEMCPFSYDMLINSRKPLIISDTARFSKISPSSFSENINKETIGSYIIAPIVNRDEFLGFLELASPRKYELNGSSSQQLATILPILSMAIGRFKNEERNRREAIIQQECTTIHPAVMWRFVEEADKFIRKLENNEKPVFRDIVFKQVFPLYGQLDIKGSSEKRNSAVRDDLNRQLEITGNILFKAWQKTKLPIYEELKYRVESFQRDVNDELLSGSEQKVVHFLEEEINPVLQQLNKSNSSLRKEVDAYFQLLNPELHSIYEVRKRYDDSVNEINQSLAAYLDERQVEAQKMFPHYFERYKTDGVEYNMYIGQSIASHLEFSDVYLHNLQLWQLMVTCDMELKFAELKERLQSDIEIASLILVYSTPLSVHFRMDEKRFDVEGAYNARYEIVKKRIDKSHIKGTKERVTQPGKIAIIFSSDHEAYAYERYISFLESKGYLQKNSKEMVEVEDLQGISGLKALRVSINFSNEEFEKSYTVNEILREYQTN